MQLTLRESEFHKINDLTYTTKNGNIFTGQYVISEKTISDDLITLLKSPTPTYGKQSNGDEAGIKYVSGIGVLVYNKTQNQKFILTII